MKSNQLKLVFEGKAVEANFIRNILEKNGISSIVKDDMISQVFPLYVASGELKPVKVYVDQVFYHDGRKLVDIYTKNITDISTKDEK